MKIYCRNRDLCYWTCKQQKLLVIIFLLPLSTFCLTLSLRFTTTVSDECWKKTEAAATTRVKREFLEKCSTTTATTYSIYRNAMQWEKALNSPIATHSLPVYAYCYVYNFLLRLLFEKYCLRAIFIFFFLAHAKIVRKTTKRSLWSDREF